MRSETVLIIDDDRMVARVLSTTLHHFDLHNIVTVAEWPEAMEQIVKEQFDLIFLDINLVGHKGWELLEIIKAKSPRSFVVMFSGESTLENVRKAIQMGAGGFVVKPFSRDKIQDMLKKFDNHLAAKAPSGGVNAGS